MGEIERNMGEKVGFRWRIRIVKGFEIGIRGRMELRGREKNIWRWIIEEWIEWVYVVSRLMCVRERSDCMDEIMW